MNGEKLTPITNKPSLWALSPLLVFLCLYLVTSIIVNDFYKVPITIAFMVSSVYAVCITKGLSLNERMLQYSIGAANKNIILMIWIFILAGAFAQSAKDIGAIDATVNLTLLLLPDNLLLAGIFLAACFISLSIGTSVGTIVALVPVAAGIAEKTDMNLAFMTGIVVGGAFFGDNLSFISDTTIAATRTQGVAMKDKFKANFLMVLPAVIINIVLLFFNSSSTALDESALTWDFIQLIPYILVIVLSLIGINVILAMGAGIAAGLIIGIAQGSFSLAESLTVVGNGIISMEDTAVIAVMVGGLVALMHYLGGIQWLLNSLSRSVKSRSGAELSIAALVTLLDLATTNNTISIITAGPIAKDISQKYGVSPVRAASILDLFSSAGNGVCPWAGQILAASGLAGVSTLSIVPFCWYSIMMFIFGVIFILIGWPKGIVKNTEQAPAAK